MKTFGYWLIALSIPFNMGMIDIDTMGFIGAHGGGIEFILILGISAICSAILVIYSIVSIILFSREKEKEDYLPIIIYPVFLSLQIVAWIRYFMEY